MLERQNNLPKLELDYSKLFDSTGKGVVVAIAKDAQSGEELMVGYMDLQAFDYSLKTGFAVFWSRSRKEYWLKGSGSGSWLDIQSWKKDCDGDVLLMKVNPNGPVCHEDGKFTCFD